MATCPRPSSWLSKTRELGVNSLEFSSSWNLGLKKLDALEVKDILHKFKLHFPNLSWQLSNDIMFKETNYLQLDITKSGTIKLES